MGFPKLAVVEWNEFENLDVKNKSFFGNSGSENGEESTNSKNLVASLQFPKNH